MGQFKFMKMHGLGNNYVYINLFEEMIPEDKFPSLAVKVANVYTGIGSDGMILICPSEVAPVKMRIFNSDGSEGKNCGNGLRCVAKYAFEKKIVKSETFKIETLSGLVDAKVHLKNGVVDEVTIDMGAPRLKRKDIPMIGDPETEVIHEVFEVNGKVERLSAVSMGNPHGIIFLDDITAAPLTTLGPIIEKDQRFPDGVNVEFVEVVNEKELNFRVWERGSGVTQACGTGACAAVVASILNEKVRKDDEVIVHLAGGDLKIKWTSENNVWMTGPAEVICEGVFYYE